MEIRPVYLNFSATPCIMFLYVSDIKYILTANIRVPYTKTDIQNVHVHMLNECRDHFSADVHYHTDNTLINDAFN